MISLFVCQQSGEPNLVGLEVVLQQTEPNVSVSPVEAPVLVPSISSPQRRPWKL